MEQAEKELREDIKEYFQILGWFIFPIDERSFYCYPGISNFIALKNGRVIFVEVKMKNGIQKKEQANFENNIKEHGGIYFIARSTEDVDFHLSENGLSWL